MTHTHTHTHRHICLHKHTHTHTHRDTYVCTNTHTHTHTHTHHMVYKFFECVSTCACVCVCVCVSVVLHAAHTSRPRQAPHTPTHHYLPNQRRRIHHHTGADSRAARSAARGAAAADQAAWPTASPCRAPWCDTTHRAERVGSYTCPCQRAACTAIFSYPHVYYHIKLYMAQCAICIAWSRG